MKILYSCTACEKEHGRHMVLPYWETYHDDRIIRTTCSRGHQAAVVLINSKFEILMESGALALSEGFTFEAVASFSAALERFFDFCLEVICHYRGITRDVYQKMYNQISKQSERQLGAFITVYALEFGLVYRPNQRMAKFRNDVLHNGHIAGVEGATEYCRFVYDQVYEIVNVLEESMAMEIAKIRAHEKERRVKEHLEGDQVTTIEGVSFFNVNQGTHIPTFDEAFVAFQSSQDGIKSTPRMKK